MKQWIYSFGDGFAEGNAKLSHILGGKGANLAEMCNMSLAIPPGFTLSTEVCAHYYSHNKELPPDLEQAIAKSIIVLENNLGRKFGDYTNPLLVSVRSGAQVSMPGMMDTILNLGLNDRTVVGLANSSNNRPLWKFAHGDEMQGGAERRTGAYSRLREDSSTAPTQQSTPGVEFPKRSNERFAYDSYRRFIQMYSNVVLGIEHHEFEACLESMKQDNNIVADVDLSIENLKELVSQFKSIVKTHSGRDFPQDVNEQLMRAVIAVLNSWMCARAVTYRKLNNISVALGTAVTIQSMVFGNMGSLSATGVGFTRNPSNGAKFLYGEYLANAQGEDVVAGIRTPQSITKAARIETGESGLSLEETMPALYQELLNVGAKLESHCRDMQDIEFTIEEGKLWILQTRSGKRTAQAALKIAVDLVAEGMITKNEALQRINPDSLNQLLHPMIDPKAKKKVFAKGLPASPGAASGVVAFSADEAAKIHHLGQEVILVRAETSPEDIQGMYVSQGIVTSRGGMTSHAAVVARGMGKPCIVGAGNIHIDYATHKMNAGNTEIKQGDFITVDGSTGEVMLGQMPTVRPAISEYFATLTSWADEAKTLSIRANAETVADIKVALEFGAEGIGLCRTEHMFFDNDRITSVRKMIIARNLAERAQALSELLPMQKQDFVGILALMKDKPVNIRLLDMPLHEFLPHTEEEILEVAKSAGIEERVVLARTKQLHEVNPMLGHRGSRIGITYPEIYEMQAEAIFEAMAEVNLSNSLTTNVEVMVPLIATDKEMQVLRNLIEAIAVKVEARHKMKLNYKIGTMIELPRAALQSGKIAQYAEFMSYGTNDLTQTTFGLSRDDSAQFIPDYLEKGILAHDPFVELDIEGVGELMEISSTRARKTNSKIKLGICGEHGGNANSIKFCHKLGFDYVSCSPYRIPIARLAAAQAATKDRS